jgi:hypothetical protein
MWTETARLAATANKICSWLARQPNISFDRTSDYTADWRPGSAHFRFQLLEVPPLDSRNASAWNVARRWRRQSHRLFVASLLSVEPGDTEGIKVVNSAVRGMVAAFDGEQQIVANYQDGKQALKREMKVAHAVSLACLDPSVPTSIKSAEELTLEAKLTSVPMTSAEKPDINGFREGDRVRLVNAFAGEKCRYEAGHEGTVLVTNTSPADIRLCRDGDLHEVYMDGGMIIMTVGADLEKIPGRAEVFYSADGERVWVET